MDKNIEKDITQGQELTQQLEPSKKTDYEKWLEQERLKEEEGFHYYAYGEAKVDPKHLSWIVITESINKKKIIPYNIFTHSRFYEDLYKLRKNIQKVALEYKKELESRIEWMTAWDKNDKPFYSKDIEYNKKALRKFNKMDFDSQLKFVFEKEVRSYLRYYFGSKCEWEIVVTTWPARLIDASELEVSQKLDVYEQVMMNWQPFIEYLERNLKLLKAPKYSKDKTK